MSFKLWIIFILDRCSPFDVNRLYIHKYSPFLLSVTMDTCVLYSMQLKINLYISFLIYFTLWDKNIKLNIFE